jgi:hypothetical protein
VAPAAGPALPEAGTSVLSATDRTRIAEARRLSDRLGDAILDGWSRAPFAVLLVADDREILIGHPAPSGEFHPLGRDVLLGEPVAARPRQLAAGLLATFPAVPGSPVPTIVVGRAEATDARASTPWVVTLLHEHFHQVQMSWPGYQPGVTALDLAGGDTTGMWMLDYPFPYDDPGVGRSFAALGSRLIEALDARGTPRFDAAVRAYVAARAALRERLDPADYRYLAFQLWQEGIARYTEMRVAAWAAERYRPSARFRSLADFEPFAGVAGRLAAGLRAELAGLSLREERRAAFYPVGAAEGLILDLWSPHWRRRYLAEPFDTGPYFDREPARASASARRSSAGMRPLPCIATMRPAAHRGSAPAAEIHSGFRDAPRRIRTHGAPGSGLFATPITGTRPSSAAAR